MSHPTLLFLFDLIEYFILQLGISVLVEKVNFFLHVSVCDLLLFQVEFFLLGCYALNWVSLVLNTTLEIKFLRLPRCKSFRQVICHSRRERVLRKHCLRTRMLPNKAYWLRNGFHSHWIKFVINFFDATVLIYLTKRFAFIGGVEE